MKEFDYISYITATRRKLHTFPEIAYNEFETQKFITGELESLGVPYVKVGTGVIARINAGKPGTMAFRADIDALPVTEANDVPYKSKTQGMMHACGHDGHIALLLAFIRYCKNNPGNMANNAVFIFQPAEEAEGGAITMIENGALDNVDEIYAVHVDPSLPEGVGGLREGVSMAGAYEFDMEFEGESCHCAEKQLGRDALHACIEAVYSVYEGIPGEIKGKTIFHAGKISGGYARNIVADKCVANCTIRYFEEGHLDTMLRLINSCLKNAQEKYGVKCGIRLLTNYVPLVNGKRCLEKAAKYIKGETIPVKYSAEDFAFYLKEVEGCIIWLGVKGEGAAKKLHSPDFDFDEKALNYGLGLYKSLIKEKING